MSNQPITTYFVSLNASHDEVHSIQHFIIKLVSDLTGRCPTWAPFAYKTNCHDITEILLKVAINIINQTVNI